MLRYTNRPLLLLLLLLLIAVVLQKRSQFRLPVAYSIVISSKVTQLLGYKIHQTGESSLVLTSVGLVGAA